MQELRDKRERDHVRNPTNQTWAMYDEARSNLLSFDHRIIENPGFTGRDRREIGL